MFRQLAKESKRMRDKRELFVASVSGAKVFWPDFRQKIARQQVAVPAFFCSVVNRF